MHIKNTSKIIINQMARIFQDIYLHNYCMECYYLYIMIQKNADLCMNVQKVITETKDKKLL